MRFEFRVGTFPISERVLGHMIWAGVVWEIRKPLHVHYPNFPNSVAP